jgi:endonuclease/exonuclease/phosphatase (EEP) superfamily protein YafD
MLHLITVLIALPLVLGYFGTLHPALDAFAHFRVYALGIWIVWLMVRALIAHGTARRLWLALGLASVLLLGDTMRPRNLCDQPHRRTLTHLQYNINLNNPRIEEIKTFIRTHHVDIVTLQEVTRAHEASLRRLADEGYRWQAYCMRKTTQEALISRYPFVPGSVRCEEHRGFVSARIDLGDRNLTVGSIHLFLPFPFGQHEQITRLSDAFRDLPDPKLIAGDFNAVPWSHTVRRVEALTRTHALRGLWRTIPTDNRRKPYVPLPIDNVLVSPSLHAETIETAPDMGSDHWPVLTRIGLGR